MLLRQTEPANAMLTRLSSFLRHTLVMRASGKVTVAEEVETLQLYLEIERMRFEERLRTEFRIDPAAAHAMIPSLLLQPLVENAIKYGVSAQEEGAEHQPRRASDKRPAAADVADTGPGMQIRRTQRGAASHPSFHRGRSRQYLATGWPRPMGRTIALKSIPRPMAASP